MLTKDLIQCRMQRGALKPQFVSVETLDLLQLAGELLVAYNVSAQPLRCEIEELVEPLVSGFRQLKLAKGIWKIVDDRAEFSSPEEIDYGVERRRLFEASALLIRSGIQDEAAFQKSLNENCADSRLLAEGSFFADLPENDRLTSFRSLTARQVLERYNVGLVQGLLLRASRLELWLHDDEASKLRRLLRYLRFFRLMATAERDKKTGGVHLTVDGPGCVLEQSKRYGLQLANFFPAVCSLKHWRMKADIDWQNTSRVLTLDESSELVCPYHNFIAYAPEEIGLFERYFKETSLFWKLVEETPFIEDGQGGLIFPDFSFQNERGVTVHLELFHRWHRSELSKRLDYCDAHGEVPLILGVDRWLLRDEELAERLETSSFFAANGFLFRDYPTVEKTVKILERWNNT